jgi:CRP-like cAMP-binding protein
MGGQEMPHSQNRLLARLGERETSHFSTHLKVVALKQGEILADAHGKVLKVYFPHSGIISCVVALNDGSMIETGMIGNDGAFGAAQALDDKISLNKVVIQVPGMASVIDPERLREAADRSKPLRGLLIEYEMFLLAQVQQTAACNALHDIETRMCRWLLRMHELAGLDLPLTQDFLAQMMGVRRTSVTGVACEMQRAGMISYNRGHLHIIDIRQVEMKACECHGDVRSHYERMIGRNGEEFKHFTNPLDLHL